MLTVRARNIFTRPDDSADYTVSVLVNSVPIWNGTVTHNRANGAGDLLREIARNLDMGRQHGSNV